MADPYGVRNSQGELVATIDAGTVDKTSTSLTLHGRRVGEYGLARNQNLVYLLENFSNTVAPENPIIGQLWWKTNSELFAWQSGGSPEAPAWGSVVPPAAGLGFTVVAGTGLVGGGFPTASPAQTLIDVGTGTGITLAADSISINESEVLHDSTGGFVANEHINHSSIVLTAGAGLTGGGDITANRTFTVGAGDGIKVEAGGINVDSTVVTIAGSPSNQTIGGVKTFTDQLRSAGSGIGGLHYAFASDTDTGFYRSAPNTLNFATGGVNRIEVDPNGVMSGLTTNYQTLVTEDDDIPNKQYVDATVSGSGGTSPTENTFSGTTTLTGLDSTQTYLVMVYGVLTSFGGTGTRTLDAVQIRAGTTLGTGNVLAQTPLRTINWPDGEPPTYTSFVVNMLGLYTSCHCQIHDASARGYGADTYSRKILAMQLTNN